MKWATTILVTAVAGLLALGLVILYSASMAQADAAYLTMQLRWGGIGLVACMATAVFDYRWLQRLALPVTAVTLLLLFLVLIPGVGVAKNGARRWFDLGPMLFQPSEMAKIGLIIGLAAYGARFREKMHTLKHGLIIPGGILALGLGMVFMEPDFGTTLLIATVGGIVLLVAGANWKYVIPPAALGLGLFAIAVFNDPVRMKRITAFLHPEQHQSDTGYQAYQAMLALGNGGATGLGLGNGRQKLGFVPEHHTDFIFSIIGEELGVVATLGVVLAFMILVVCGLYIAWKSGNRFGQLLGVGITFLIGLQAFINIGVVTSALPNKGLPLPFISYGGSSLVFMLIAVGLLLSIANYADETEPASVADVGEDEIDADNPFIEAP
jgi:cell division protein FtsW